MDHLTKIIPSDSGGGTWSGLGGLRRCSHLVTDAQRPWGWVREGVQGEGSSENVQGSGWLRIHLPAITMQQQLQ